MLRLTLVTAGAVELLAAFALVTSIHDMASRGICSARLDQVRAVNRLLTRLACVAWRTNTLGHELISRVVGDSFDARAAIGAFVAGTFVLVGTEAEVFAASAFACFGITLAY